MATGTKPVASGTAQEPSHAVATAGVGGSLALPASVLAELAAAAKEDAAKERPSVSKFSLQSGVLSYGGNPMPENKTEGVILVAAYRNAWYKDRFNKDKIKNPNCFALQEDDKDMAPHENVAEPESDVCSTCSKNEWGSDPNGGRGKACKQSRRLVLLPGSAVDGGAEAVKTAELGVLDLPVTSVKNYSQFVNTLAASAGVPIWATITQIKVVPDAKTQFKVLFQAMRIAPGVDILDALKSRRDEALRIALTPYEALPSEEEEAAAEASRSVGKKPAKF